MPKRSSESEDDLQQLKIILASVLQLLRSFCLTTSTQLLIVLMNRHTDRALLDEPLTSPVACLFLALALPINWSDISSLSTTVHMARTSL